MKYRPRTAPVEAFQFRRGMKHPVLIYHPHWEHEGGPDLGDDYSVPIGHQKQTREVRDGEYVIIKADGLCTVMQAGLFEAIYEAES